MGQLKDSYVKGIGYTAGFLTVIFGISFLAHLLGYKTSPVERMMMTAMRR